MSIIASFRRRQPLLPSEIERAFIEELEKSFTKIAITEKGGKKRVTGRIIRQTLNPVVSFTGNLEVETKDERGRLQFTGRTHTNVWFWTTLILMMLFFLPLMLFAIYMYWSQTKRAVAGFEQARERVQFRLNDW